MSHFVMKKPSPKLRAELKKWLICLIIYKIIQIPVYKEKVGEFEKEKIVVSDLQSGLA